MPASVNESISASLQLSMWAPHTKAVNGLDDGAAVQQRMASVAKLVPDISYETSTDSYYSSVLHSLKAKYSEASNTAPVANGHTADNVLAQPTITLFPLDRVNMAWPKDKDVKVGSGFSNAGNTCYLNSVLQALFHIPPLYNWLALNDHEHQSNCATFRGMSQDCIVCCMALTLRSSQSCNTFRPTLILSKLRTICKRLQVGHQEDAMEFLRYLLESMEKSYLHRHTSLKLDNRSKETTPLNQIFGGYIRTEVTCMSCRAISTTFQHFLDLTLDITRATHLENALDNYFAPERLEENSYRCDKCKKKVPATKQFFVERPPNVLCIQLKRFSIDGKKINKKIILNERVNLLKYKPRVNGCHQKGANYKLVAGVNHMGHSAQSGHYTTQAYAHNSNLYLFDDTNVQYQPPRTFSYSEAYVLMYLLEPSKKQVESLSQPPSVVLGQPARSPMLPKAPFLPTKLHQTPKPAIIFNHNRSMIPSAVASASSANKISPVKKVVTIPSVKSEFTNGNANPSTSGIQSRPSTSQPSPRLIGPSMPSLVPYQSDHSSEDESEETSVAKPEAKPVKAETSSNGETKPTAAPVAEKPTEKQEPAPTNGTAEPPPPPPTPRHPSPQEYSVKSTTPSWDVSSADKTPPNQPISKLPSNSHWVVTEVSKQVKIEDGKPKESLKRKRDSPDSDEMEWIEKPKDSAKIQTAGAGTNVSSSTALNGSKRQDLYGPLPPGQMVAGLPRNGLKGYGGAEVKSWNGTKSLVDKQTYEDHWMAKRDKDYSCDYDDEMDGGKKKKMKSSNGDSYSHGSSNKFQAVANYRQESERNRSRDWRSDKFYDRNKPYYDDRRGGQSNYSQHQTWRHQNGNNHKPYNRKFEFKDNRHKHRHGHSWRNNHRR
ncbi:ubiquitin carboxyl-terminal hydrolase 36 [Cloeon dipterum]|uniref:ubiquitin carboxyl-terminal hydrolase 36 n=1 Tax=Cloeon dipterum TaxID=197152 RepID=UPI00321F6E85